MEDMSFFNDDDDDDDDVRISEQDLLDYMVLKIIEDLGQTHLAFKGGYMLNQLIPAVSRQTHDIDFSVDSVEEYEKVKVVLKSIGNYFVKQGYVNNFKIKENITPTSSGGIDFYDKDAQKLLGVDVGWHQLSLGTKWYSLSIGDIHAFSVERMLSDKVYVVFSSKRFRRAKDLYDIYFLLENFDVDFKLFKELCNARGNIDLNKNPFREEVLIQYKHAWDKLKIISIYHNVEINKPSFSEVIERLGHFCFPIMCSFSREYKKWSKDSLKWEE